VKNKCQPLEKSTAQKWRHAQLDGVCDCGFLAGATPLLQVQSGIVEDLHGVAVDVLGCEAGDRHERDRQNQRQHCQETTTRGISI